MRMLLTAAVLIAALTVAAAAPQPPPAEQTTRVLAFDVLPCTIQGKVVVPLRAIFEWLGARVEYNSGRIDAYEGHSAIPRVTLTIGQSDAHL